MEAFHVYEWPSTKNFSPEICHWLRIYNEEEKNKIFFENNAFAVEKIDGTNVSKDNDGQLYSRRNLISPEAEKFLKTTLKNVKAADINLVKRKLCENIFLEETLLQKFIVYGELIVNEKYDYKQRKLRGSWLVFGAMVIAEPQHLEIISRKLKESNFNIALEEGKIRIFANSSFFNLVHKCGLETPKVKGEDLCLFDIVLQNKEEMETGKLEGLVITFKNVFDNQHLIYKWKGAQEEQPKAQKEVSEALEILKEGKKMADDKTTQIFSAIHAVVFAGHEKNPLVKKAKTKSEHRDKTDKKIITDGVFSSMTKYDNVNVYKDDPGAIKKYKEKITEEVKEHFMTEKGLEPSRDKEVFIKSVIDSIVCGKINIK